MLKTCEQVAEDGGVQDLMQVGRLILDEVAEEPQGRVPKRLLYEATIHRGEERLGLCQHCAGTEFISASSYLWPLFAKAFQSLSHHSFILLVSRGSLDQGRIESSHPYGKESIDDEVCNLVWRRRVASVGDGNEVYQCSNGFVYDEFVDARIVQETLVDIEPRQYPIRNLQHWQKPPQNGYPRAEGAGITLDVFVEYAQQLILEAVRGGVVVLLVPVKITGDDIE